jgi:hypothetical protein
MGAMAHGGADISLTTTPIGGTGPAHEHRANHGCRRMRELRQARRRRVRALAARVGDDGSLLCVQPEPTICANRTNTFASTSSCGLKLSSAFWFKTLERVLGLKPCTRPSDRNVRAKAERTDVLPAKSRHSARTREDGRQEGLPHDRGHLPAVAPARRHGRTDKRPGLCGRARQAAERARITTGISRRVFAW